MSQTFNCPSCNGPLDYQDGGAFIVRCAFCNNSVIVPTELWDRAGARSGITSQTGEVMSPAANNAHTLSRIEQLVREGNNIGAIKLYRQLFEVSLLEAKEAIEALEKGQPLPMPEQPGTRRALSAAKATAAKGELEQILDDIGQLLQAGNKIQAIKVYREKFDVGLIEAKESIELLEAGKLARVIDRASGMERRARPAAPPRTQAAPKAPSSYLTRAAGFLGIAAFIFLTLILPIGMAILSVVDERTHLVSIWGGNLNPFARARVLLAFGEEGVDPGLFTRPDLLTTDGSGYIYVTNRSDSRIQRFDAEGHYTSYWVVNPETAVDGLAATVDDIVYVLQDGIIYRYEGATGRLLDQVGKNDRFKEVVATTGGGIIALSDNDGWVEFDSGGRMIQSVSVQLPEQERIEHIAVDGLGNVYTLGESYHRLGWTDVVSVFTPDGKLITRFGSNGDEPGEFSSPGTLAVDGKQQVYVSDFDGMMVFDASGRYLYDIPSIDYTNDMEINAENQLVMVHSYYNKIIRYQLRD